MENKSILPYGGIKWLKNSEEFDIRNVSKDFDIDYILELHIEYPEELHDLYNDYPYCTEQSL